VNQQRLVGWWTLTMMIIAVALPVYFTVYVWRRVDQPHTLAPGWVLPHSTGDYAFFYAAARAMRRGEDIYTVEGPGFARAGYLYPPLVAFLYQPLSLWEYGDGPKPKPDFFVGARIAMLIDELAFFIAAAFMAKAVLERWRPGSNWQMVLTVAVLTALLTSDRVKGELQMIQTNGLVALGIAIGFWALDRKPIIAGLALGFAINIKFQALGLLLYFLFRRRWKAAGATAVGSAFWALLPALSIGWMRDIEYVGRSCAGVLNMMGFHIADNGANVEPLASSFSISITSSAGRLVEHTGWPVSPYVLSGAVAMIWLATLGLLYHANKSPILLVPSEKTLRSPPWSQLVTLEWVAVIVAVLAFSPQTSTRQSVQAFTINAVCVVLAIQAVGRLRWLAIAAGAILWMGQNLPPGNRSGGVDAAAAFWRSIGGPCWCMLASIILLTYVTLKSAARPESAK
jgi:alpha-1,2-mannosyltransferase